MDAEPQPLKVKLLSDKACLPKRGSDGAAGYDLTRWVSAVYWATNSCIAACANTLSAANARLVWTCFKRMHSCMCTRNLVQYLRLLLCASASALHACSAEDCTIPARGKYMVNTDISVAIPPECYGRVAPRSGLAWKHSIDTGAGVIDSDYRGPLKVILFNFSDDDFQVRTLSPTAAVHQSTC